MSAKLNPFTGRLQLGGGSGGGGGGGITTIAGNSGTATGATVNLETAGTTLEFTASGDTVTLDFTELNLLIGSDGPNIVGAAQNVGYGRLPLESVVDGAANTCVGWTAGTAITNGNANVAVGTNALLICEEGSYNVAVGFSALNNFNATSTTGNIAVGQASLSGFDFIGDGNICIGQLAGANYQANESNNICLSHDGVPGDQNTIRLGDQGTGDDQQDKCFIAGIAPQTVAASSPVGINSSGQLSNLGFGTSGQVLTSNGAATSPTWQAAAGGFTEVVIRTFSTSGTYTPTTGMKYCIVECIGGGGGGGSSVNTGAGLVSAGGAGGGGGYARSCLSAATIGASQAVTIGAGGAGATPANPSGATGGTTSLGSLVSATGGLGGGRGPAAVISLADGGAGGLTMIGQYTSRGNAGGHGMGFYIGTTAFGSSGNGGASVLGAGGDGRAGNIGAPGINAVSAGGGGTGSYIMPSESGQNGGDGAAGRVIITEYI